MSSYLIAPRTVHHGKAVITGDEARHAIRVARRRVGEHILLIDGAGTAYEARVSALGHDRVECEVLNRVEEYGEPHVKVTLAAALVKSDRFETLIEKAVELGVSAIWPMETAFSVVRNPSENKWRRWSAIALSATKQCLRSRVPEVARPLALADLAGRLPEFDGAFVAWEGESEHALGADTVLVGTRFLVVIGPEGGFKGEEITLLRAGGARTITLGPRRLRAETAAISALVLVMDRTGELNRPLKLADG